MSSGAISSLKTQWAYLLDLFEANMNFGSGGPGTGSNSAGLLQSVASVGQSEWPEFNALPFVGVALKNWVIEELAAQQRKLIATFQIVVVVDVVASGSTAIKLADAYMKAMALLDDDAGNGVLPILSTPANFTLGNAVSKIIARRGNLDWASKPGGKGTDYVAYANVMLFTEKYNLAPL